MSDSKPADVPPADLEALRANLDGDALVRGDSAWEAARQAWNLVAVQEPALVVMAESAGDVAAAVGFARDQGLQIAPQSTGHGAAPLSDLGSAVLLKTSRMAGVEIDPGAGVASVGAGAKWGEVCAPAGEHDLVCL